MPIANRLPDEIRPSRILAGGSRLSDETPVPEDKPTAPAWLGKRVGHFKLIGLLGQGAMGRVFRVEDTLLRRYVALKVLPKAIKRNEKAIAIERLIHEAQACATLDHPNVIAVYEVNEAGGVYYIAMELAEGGSLRELVKAAGPLETARACLLCADAADALAHAHTLGIVHRDVKPANLMLTRSGRCKVTDFGLARGVESADLSKPIPEAVGTPQFIAPELLRGEPASPFSDIYSLGATLWYLLTGRAVFDATGTADLLQKHLESPVPDLRALRPDVPSSLAKALQRALAKKPMDRFESAAQFAKVLRVHTIPVDSSSSFALGGVALDPEDTATINLSRTRLGSLQSDLKPAQLPAVEQSAAPAQPALARGNRKLLIGSGAVAATAAVIFAALVPTFRGMKHSIGSVAQGSAPAVAPIQTADPRTPPPGWVPMDLGSPALSGKALVERDVWTISGAGVAQERADQLHFVSKRFTGDGVFSAKLENLAGGEHAQCGLMFRNGSGAGAAIVALVCDPAGNVAFQWREAQGKPLACSQLKESKPLWLKLARTDASFSAFCSGDGVNWKQIGAPQDVQMSPVIRAGIAVTSNDEKTLATAQFQDVSLNDSLPQAGQ